VAQNIIQVADIY